MSKGRCQFTFVFKCCKSRAWNLSGNVGGLEIQSLPHPAMKQINVEIEHLAVSYETQINIACQHVFVSARLVSIFQLRFKPTAPCLHLRYQVSYTNIRHAQIIPCKVDFIQVKPHIALSNEICINTQVENTLTNYVKSDRPTQRFMLLTIEWDKKCLLFTKPLHKII